MRHLIQVVVVLLTATLTAALLLCGVAQVREAAHRQDCVNRLHLLGISLHCYEDGQGRFPAAALPNPDLPPERRLSWLVALVPYVEATGIYSRMEKEEGWDSERNRFAAILEWRWVRCPGFPERPPTSTLEPTHYVALAGVGSDAATLPETDPRAGAFGYDRALRTRDLGDHAGSLLVVTETTRATGSWTAAGPPTVRGLDRAALPYLGGAGQFGGTHPGGANALFADATVRFLRDSVDPRVWEAMAETRGDPGPLPGGEE